MRVVVFFDRRNSLSTPTPPSTNKNLSLLKKTEPRRLGHRRGHRLRRLDPPRAAEGAGEGGGQGAGAARGGGERSVSEEANEQQRPRFADPRPADRGPQRREPDEEGMRDTESFCKVVQLEREREREVEEGDRGRFGGRKEREKREGREERE